MIRFRTIVVVAIAAAFALAPVSAFAGDKDEDKDKPKTPVLPAITPPVALPPLPSLLPATGKKPKTSGAPASTPTPTRPATTGTDATQTLAPATPPQLGVSLALTPAAGSVSVKLPGGRRYLDLAAAGSVPTGSVIDAREGKLDVQAALDASGATQTVRLWGAVFQVSQGASGRGLTEFRLRGGRPAGCPARGGRARARAAAAPAGRPAGLWARDRDGRFRTRGRNSVATVRGTEWLTRETCAGTLTKVTEGTVAVRDVRRGKTVVVQAGHRYLARDRG